MNDQLKPLLDLLGGHSTTLVTILAWGAALSAALSPFAVWIQHKLTDATNNAAASADGDDDIYLRKLYSAGWYRLLAFLLNFVNIRLPTLAMLERAIALQQEAKSEPPKP